MEYGLRYLGDGEVKLQGYTDANRAGNAIEKKSTSRCCFSLGSTMIIWFTRKQNSIALSLVEPEYMVASMANYEAI